MKLKPLYKTTPTSLFLIALIFIVGAIISLFINEIPSFVLGVISSIGFLVTINFAESYFREIDDE